MSVAAAENIAHLAGIARPWPELIQSCEPLALHSKFGMPLEVHRARSEDRLGVMRQLAGYFETHVSLVQAPLFDRQPVEVWGSWSASTLRKQLELRETEAPIVQAFFGKKLYTGKVSDMAVEALTLDELPPKVAGYVDKLNPTHSSREYFVEHTLAYQLSGAAKVGGVAAALACGLTIVPYIIHDERNQNHHTHFDVHAHPFAKITNAEAIARTLGRAAREREFVAQRNAYQGGSATPR